MSDEEFVHQGVKVRIIQDEDPQDPRKELLSTMACFHRRYDLGDEGHGYNSKDYPGWNEMEAAIRKQEDVAVILPLFLMDHSGLTIRTSSEKFRACDSAGWDWGQVGFIWISKANARKEYGKKVLTKAFLAKLEGYLRAEVETYDQYLTGDVWGYTVDPDGDDDSCWGFYGHDYCVEEAKRVAEIVAKRRALATAGV